MCNGRTSPQESNPAAQPVFVMTAKGDSGGVGATTTAVIIIDLLHLAGHRVAVARLDSQERLDKFCGDLPMLRLETSLLERSRDGDDAVVRSLTPFYDDAIQCLQSGTSYLLEQGACRAFPRWTTRRPSARPHFSPSAGPPRERRRRTP